MGQATPGGPPRQLLHHHPYPARSALTKEEKVGASAPWPGSSGPASTGLPGALVSSQARDDGLERNRLLPLRTPLGSRGQRRFLALDPAGGRREFPFLLSTACLGLLSHGLPDGCRQARPPCYVSFSSTSGSVSVYGK